MRCILDGRIGGAQFVFNDLWMSVVCERPDVHELRLGGRQRAGEGVISNFHIS